MNALLVWKGVDANSKDNKGLTSLAFAASWGHFKVAQVLLEHPEIKVDSTDKELSQFVSRAEAYGYGHVVKLWAEKNVDSPLTLHL